LKDFAEEYADRVINLHALPYTQDREQLYDELRAASVVLMPSWHEGFGLVAWEAIAAGVPLILSQQSGVYRLLDSEFPGAGPGCIHAIDVRGAMSHPFFVLLALVKRMLQSPPDRGQTVRVLLLARDAAEWWDRLPSKDSHCEPFLNGYAASGPVRLPVLHEAVADRNSAYQRALHAFAEKLGVSAPKVVPDLEAEHFGRPLYLQMAALLALHGERPTTAEGLTKALLNHEVRYWRGLLTSFGWAEPERLAAQLLALATLAGGFATPREARP
jgi:hypothetical protein